MSLIKVSLINHTGCSVHHSNYYYVYSSQWVTQILLEKITTPNMFFPQVVYSSRESTNTIWVLSYAFYFYTRWASSTWNIICWITLVRFSWSYRDLIKGRWPSMSPLIMSSIIVMMKMIDIIKGCLELTFSRNFWCFFHAAFWCFSPNLSVFLRSLIMWYRDNLSYAYQLGSSAAQVSARQRADLIKRSQKNHVPLSHLEVVKLFSPRILGFQGLFFQVLAPPWFEMSSLLTCCKATSWGNCRSLNSASSSSELHVEGVFQGHNHWDQGWSKVGPE